MPKFLMRWIVSAVAIAVVAWLLPGIHAGTGTSGAVTVCIAAAFLGLANAVVKPILAIMSCPLILVTLGLFLFVINAAMLMLAAWASTLMGHPLVVEGWGSAIVCSILISIVTWLLSMFVPDGKDKKKNAS